MILGKKMLSSVKMNTIDLYSKLYSLTSGLFMLKANSTRVILEGSVAVASLSVIDMDGILTMNSISKRTSYYKYALGTRFYPTLG